MKKKLLGFRALWLEFRSETGFLSTFTAQSVRIFIAHQMNSVFLWSICFFMPFTFTFTFMFTFIRHLGKTHNQSTTGPVETHRGGRNNRSRSRSRSIAISARRTTNGPVETHRGGRNIIYITNRPRAKSWLIERNRDGNQVAPLTREHPRRRYTPVDYPCEDMHCESLQMHVQGCIGLACIHVHAMMRSEGEMCALGCVLSEGESA